MGKSGKWLASMIGVVALLVVFSDASASYVNCVNGSTLTATWRANFSNVQDNPNIAVGAVLATATVAQSGTTSAIVSCNVVNGTGTGNTTTRVQPLSTGDIASNNVNGASLRLFYNGARVTSSTVYRSFTSAGTSTLTPSGLTVQLIKTSANTSFNNGFCTNNILAHLSLDGSSSYLANLDACVLGFTRATPTCSVSTTNVEIPLGNVAAATLTTSQPTSPISATKNVTLGCSYTPTVRMTMQGTQLSGAPNTVLALTGGTNVAKGVGVQLMYNSAALAIGSAVTVSSAAGTTLNVPIAARYYRTGDITAGPANATATLQFTYN
jgi:type 1 fimbria pilin